MESAPHARYSYVEVAPSRGVGAEGPQNAASLTVDPIGLNTTRRCARPNRQFPTHATRGDQVDQAISLKNKALIFYEVRETINRISTPLFIMPDVSPHVGRPAIWHPPAVNPLFAQSPRRQPAVGET